MPGEAPEVVREVTTTDSGTSSMVMLIMLGTLATKVKVPKNRGNDPSNPKKTSKRVLPWLRKQEAPDKGLSSEAQGRRCYF